MENKKQYIIRNRGNFTEGARNIYSNMNNDMSYYLINLENIPLDTPIYRIFPFKVLDQIFSTNRLWLRHPEKWDDPMENWMFKTGVTLTDGSTAHFLDRELYYGQCWTLDEESDAMWRIYSSNNDGVKVKTTIRKLLNCIIPPQLSTSEINCFIGKIEYLKDEEIKRKLIELKNIYTTEEYEISKKSAYSFYFKRSEYQLENEIRIIVKDIDKKYTKNSLPFIEKADNWLKILIDPLDLFDEIILDPKMFDNYENESVKSELIDTCINFIQKNLGFNKKVEQSLLYKKNI